MIHIIIGMVIGTILGNLFCIGFQIARDVGKLYEFGFFCLVFYTLCIPINYGILMAFMVNEFDTSRDFCIEDDEPFNRKMAFAGPLILPFELYELVRYRHGFMWGCPDQGWYQERDKKRIDEFNLLAGDGL